MRGGFAMRLRPTLLSSIIGLVLVTAAAIGGGAVFLTMSISRSLIEEARGSAVKSAREETRQFFAAGPRITDELTQLARRGVLPFDRRDLLVAQFAERLRAFPTLYSVGYGDVAGWYVGALRNRAGEVVEYIADPQIDGAMPDQVAVAADGTRSPPTDPERNPYLVVNRPWFKSGIVADGPIWSPFYTFITGATGITATSRFVPQGASAPRGVFAVDLQIDSMAKFLTTLSVGRHGAVFLVDRDGHRVVDPSGENAARTAAALDAAAAQVRTADLEHPTWVRSGSRFYEVIFEPVPTDGDVGLSIGVVVDLRDVSRGAYRHGL
ncbi:MAG TPA: cache domain-containing protein, partial [Stellaceae bacterium]|nr:cache domain-containing protein [Stellaceae bacterium]